MNNASLTSLLRLRLLRTQQRKAWHEAIGQYIDNENQYQSPGPVVLECEGVPTRAIDRSSGRRAAVLALAMAGLSREEETKAVTQFEEAEKAPTA